jgi:hypothetical protein
LFFEEFLGAWEFVAALSYAHREVNGKKMAPGKKQALRN